MRPSATKKTIQVKDEQLAQRLAAERERIAAEGARRRTIFESICTLSDPVEEGEMLKHLSVLDPPSWSEVVEERFLGRLCGYPVCTNAIKVDFRKKYTILNREEGKRERKQLVSLDEEPAKFCSDRCMALSRAVVVHLGRAQMTRIATVKDAEEFCIPREEQEWRKFLKQSECDGREELAVSSSKFGAELVKSLHELKLADNGPEETTDGDKADEEEGSDSDREEAEFLSQIKEFVGKKATTSKVEMSKKGETEWKKGFLLTADSKTEHKPSESQRETTKPMANSKEAESRKTQPLLGNVVERLATKNKQPAKKGPAIVDAPRIKAEQAKMAN